MCVDRQAYGSVSAYDGVSDLGPDAAAASPVPKADKRNVFGARAKKRNDTGRESERMNPGTAYWRLDAGDEESHGWTEPAGWYDYDFPDTAEEARSEDRRKHEAALQDLREQLEASQAAAATSARDREFLRDKCEEKSRGEAFLRNQYKSETEEARATNAQNTKEISSLKAAKKDGIDDWNQLNDEFREVVRKLTESKSEIVRLKRAKEGTPEPRVT
jgi:hypothetical protein